MITFTERLDKALRIAAWAHDKQGQYRRVSNVPFIVHPFGVMTIASQATDDEDILIGALLHDVLEDVDEKIYSEADMLRDFGPRVVGLVKDVSHNAAITDWHERNNDYLRHLEFDADKDALIISAADKINNLQSTITDYGQLGEELWQTFRTKNVADQFWWYGAVLAVLEKRAPELSLNAVLKQNIEKLRQVRAAHGVIED